MRIEWDDVNPEIGGGFTVVEGKLKNPPEGWVEDKPGHWQPQWAPCRYRRLSKMVIKDNPRVIPFCLLPELRGNVDYRTCSSCTLHKPPANFVSIDSLEEDPSRPTSIIIDYDDDPVFNPPKIITPWEPCKYRMSEEKIDCSGCKRFICACESCPLNKQTVMKKDCRECEFRES